MGMMAAQPCPFSIMQTIFQLWTSQVNDVNATRINNLDLMV